MPSGNPPNTIVAPADKSSLRPRKSLGGLLQTRLCLVPTWQGWVALLLLVVLLVTVGGRNICAFLTVDHPVEGGVLVIEGWTPAYVSREAVDEFRRHSYAGIYVTGEPIEEGNPYLGYGSYADFTAEKLREMGAPPGSVHSVPAPPVGRDRTYAMATALKARLEAEGVPTGKINLISLGPHSRRSRLLYQFAFGPESQIGIIGVAPQDYDAVHWWRTSNGVRTVISELIAYGYARLLFRPTNN